MKCMNCGNELQNDQKFCTVCGYKVEDSINQQTQDHQVIIIPQTQSTNYRIPLLIGGGIIGLIILIITCLIITNKPVESEVIISQIQISESLWGNTTVTLTVDNLSDSAIKDVDIGFMAWDKNQLPVIVSEEFDYYSETYCLEGVCNAINIEPRGRKPTSIEIVSNPETIHYVLPFIISYTSYDGSDWKNPHVDSIRKKAGYEIKNLDDVFVLKKNN